MARGDAGSAVDKDRAPTASEKAHLKELVSGIVLAQGNVFIKELLRDKGLTIGRTKEDFARHLAAAVDGGQLRLEDVEHWLAQVEGWGEQHIYLWRLPASLVPDGLFTSEPLLRRRLGRAGLEPLLGAPSTLAFPDPQELTGIRQADDSIRFVWHKLTATMGLFTWVRPAPLGAVRFGLFSLERRIHVRTQLRSSDVWDLLGRIVSAA